MDEAAVEQTRTTRRLRHVWASFTVAFLALVPPAVVRAHSPRADAAVLGERVRVRSDRIRDDAPDSSRVLVGTVSGVSGDSLSVMVLPGVTGSVWRGTPGLERSLGMESRGQGALRGAGRGFVAGVALGAFTYSVTKRGGTPAARDAALIAGGATLAVSTLHGWMHPVERWIPWRSESAAHRKGL